MPSASAIVDQAFQIAHRFGLVALGWHLAAALIFIVLLRGWWRPSRRAGALLLAAPLASVAIVAAMAGNPFNAAVMAMLALSRAIIGFKDGAGEPLRLVEGYRRVLPATLVGFGLVYPHFLEGSPWAAYLYAAPFGLLPCPTLSLVTGVTLLVHGLDSRRWCWLLAAATSFYGLLGVFHLRVTIDLVLLVGALALAARAIGPQWFLGVLRLRPKDGLLAYFILAFAISWGLVLLVIAGAGIVTGSAPPLAGALLVFLAMLAGPSLASVGVTVWLQGWSGVRRLAAAVRGPRFPLRWYGMVALTPLLLALLLLGLSLGWRHFTPDIFTSQAPGRIAASALLVGLAAGLFEELGWTGFATPRLLARWSVVRAGVTLGVPWALWHALADYWGSATSFGGLWPAHLFEWVIALTAFRVLMTWTYARTGSLPLAMAMHAGFTGGQALLWPGTIGPAEGLIWYGYFGCVLWIAVLWFVPGDRSVRASAQHWRRPCSFEGRGTTP